MANAVVIVLILAAVALAVRSTVGHFKGGGGCCGGGSGTIIEEKELDAPVIATRVLRIDGMRCDGCRAKVQEALNRIDGAAARVSLRRHTATVRLSRAVSDAELAAAVSAAGAYSVRR